MVSFWQVHLPVMDHLSHVSSQSFDRSLLIQDWQVPLGRRFRALKVWFVLRTYGQQGLQSYIEHHLRLAGLFQGLVEADERFEITAPPRFGLVCFALKVRPLVIQMEGQPLPLMSCRAFWLTVCLVR